MDPLEVEAELPQTPGASDAPKHPSEDGQSVSQELDEILASASEILKREDEQEAQHREQTESRRDAQLRNVFDLNCSIKKAEWAELEPEIDRLFEEKRQRNMPEAPSLAYKFTTLVTDDSRRRKEAENVFTALEAAGALPDNPKDADFEMFKSKVKKLGGLDELRRSSGKSDLTQDEVLKASKLTCLGSAKLSEPIETELCGSIALAIMSGASDEFEIYAPDTDKAQKSLSGTARKLVGLETKKGAREPQPPKAKADKPALKRTKRKSSAA